MCIVTFGSLVYHVDEFGRGCSEVEGMEEYVCRYFYARSGRLSFRFVRDEVVELIEMDFKRQARAVQGSVFRGLRCERSGVREDEKWSSGKWLELSERRMG